MKLCSLKRAKFNILSKIIGLILGDLIDSKTCYLIKFMHQITKRSIML